AQLRKSIMHQVVTRGLDDSVVLKDSGVGWVGRIPVHWHVVWLKNVAAVNALSLGADTDSAHEFNYLEISNVNCLGVIDPSAIKKVRFGDAPSRARRIVCDGDILISSVRPNLQGAAFFERAPADLVCSTGFNVVRPDEKKFWPKFLYYVLTSSYAWQYFEAMTTGANYPAIAEKYFLKLVFPFPPKLEQNSIVRYLDRVCHGFVELNMKLTSQIAALYDYRKSLIHECVTGKRRITAADIQKVKGDV
ncbi:MAG: restriction endonuclease subunit S, partial [Myxococcota bacterium]